MLKKVIASVLALQFFMPAGLFANQALKTSASEVEILLSRPKIVYAKDAEKLGVSSLTLSGLGAFVYANGKRMNKYAYMKKFPLDALNETVYSMMNHLRKDGGAFAKMNPSLERQISKAYFELRSMYTKPFLYRYTPNQKVLPSYIINHFVFELDRVSFPKGNPAYTSKFKQLIRDVNAITGRKKTAKGAAGVAMLSIAALTAWIIAADNGNTNNLISNNRAALEQQLFEVNTNAPQYFALAVLNMPENQKKLAASIIAESASSQNGGFYTPLKTQIEGIVSEETRQSVQTLLESENALDKEFVSQSEELKEGLASAKQNGFKLSLNLQ